jgi:hypothetical protein
MGLAIHPGEAGYVYQGVWTNWSHGAAVGLTLTLSRQHEALLTAFVAVLVTFTGRRFWKVVRLIAHQILSSDKPKDAIYHQRQVILRNSDSSAEGLWQLIRQSWAWHGSVGAKAWKRNSGLLLLATLNTAFFIAASILSSQVTYSAGDEVLIDSPFRGRISASVTQSNILPILNEFYDQRYLDKANYADTCYEKGAFSKNVVFTRKICSSSMLREEFVVLFPVMTNYARFRIAE